MGAQPETNLRTSRPVISQYLFCGKNEGGASIDASADKKTTLVKESTEVFISERTRRYVFLLFWALFPFLPLLRLFYAFGSRCGYINVHTLLSFGTSAFSLSPLALALLCQHSLQVLRPPIGILRVRGVFERTSIREVRQGLRECLPVTQATTSQHGRQQEVIVKVIVKGPFVYKKIGGSNNTVFSTYRCLRNGWCFAGCSKC